jgi:hypothetical protein
MKKRFLGIMVLFLVGGLAMAQTNEEMYNRARLLIYGENPVMAIAKVSNDELLVFNSYGLGRDWKFEGQRMLNDDDALLLAFLSGNEWQRRNGKTRDEFFLFIHDREEEVKKWPMNAISGKATGWLMVLEMAIRTGQLPVGKQ